MSRIRYGRWLIVWFLVVACLSPTVALASNKGAEVPCRVEPNQIFSVSVTDGDVDYGVLAVGTTEDTVGTDTQTATNGDEIAKFRIKSSDAGGVTPWTLAAATGAPNEFTHKASITGGAPWLIVMTTADQYVDLVDTVAVGASQNFDLQFGMPSSVTDYGAHTITVTILATAP